MAENWYIVLELEFDPPVEDEQKIAEKIEERARFWSTHFNDFKNGPKYRIWHGDINQIKKDMIGPANIRKQLAAEACKIKYGPLDNLIKTIGRKGNITSGEGEKIAQREKVSIDMVKKRAKALNISWVVEESIDYRTVYDKLYKTKPQNSATYDGMGQLLASFGADNLYTFLFQDTDVKNPQNLDYGTIRTRSDELKKTFNKTDSRSGNGKKLCGHSENIFKDKITKEQYDQYLEYVKRKAILDDAKSVADISGELSVESFNDYINRLTLILKSKDKADELLTAFCKIEKIPFKSGDKSAVSKTKTCRCGRINDVSDGRKICGGCGLELVIKCPKCGVVSDNNINVCKCGFAFENIDKAISLCELAEHSIDILDFAAAKNYLSDAERCWHGSSGVTAAKQRLSETEQRVGKEVAKMRDAINGRRFCEANSLYQGVKKLFPGYSDPEIEEKIKQALTKAKSFFSQAKSAKTDKDIFELCAKAHEVCIDLPGITELMPPPDCITGFKVTTNPISRTNVASWTAVDDRFVRYVLVRSPDGWVQNISDGEVIYTGSSSSYADKGIKAGKAYYYNVFAERAGVFSKGAKGEFKEIINKFDVNEVAITPGDSSLEISWGILPDNATAELYRVQNGTETLVTSTSAASHLITELVNDTDYEFHIAFSYNIAGKKEITSGVRKKGRPTCPPLPVETLRVKSVQDGVYEGVWVKPETGEVRLYGSLQKPPFTSGSVISLQDLEQHMSRLQMQSLSQKTAASLKDDEDGATFRHAGTSTMFVAAAVIKSETAVFGNLSRASVGASFSIKSVKEINGKINILFDPPKDATAFVVLHKFDSFAADINDTSAQRKYVPIKQYNLNSAIVLDMLEEKKYFFSVFAEFNMDGDKDYSSAAEYIFDNSPKTDIAYSIAVSKSLFGGTSIVLEFEAEQKDFILPDIDIMSSVGNAPMFKNSAEHFYDISSQNVSGSCIVKIPMPKNMPKNTYIKAFVRNNSDQHKYQLKLKLKSNYKIS